MTNFELNQEPIEPSIATTNELTNIEDKHEGWAYPTEIKSELPDAPKFNSTALLPKSMEEFVLDEADRMPCAPDYIAAALIVALGSVI